MVLAVVNAAALARAHELTLAYRAGAGGQSDQIATLHSLIRTVVSPYEDSDRTRIAIHGADVSLAPDAVSTLALVIHEFTTNAAKYGSLATRAGGISIDCFEDGDQFVLIWTEQGGPALDDHPGARKASAA